MMTRTRRKQSGPGPEDLQTADLPGICCYWAQTWRACFTHTFHCCSAALGRCRGSFSLVSTFLVLAGSQGKVLGGAGQSRHDLATVCKMRGM